jgi:hypothetical protein
MQWPWWTIASLVLCRLRIDRSDAKTHHVLRITVRARTLGTDRSRRDRARVGLSLIGRVIAFALAGPVYPRLPWHQSGANVLQVQEALRSAGIKYDKVIAAHLRFAAAKRGRAA